MNCNNLQAMLSTQGQPYPWGKHEKRGYKGQPLFEETVLRVHDDGALKSFTCQIVTAREPHKDRAENQHSHA